MKTIKFNHLLIVSALFLSFSISVTAQYNMSNHFPQGADTAAIYFNTQWYFFPNAVLPDGILHPADNAKTSAINNQDIDNAFTGEQSLLQVKNRYTIIPNPSSGKSKLKVQLKPKDSQLMLFDLTGRLQLKIFTDPGQVYAEIDVISLNKSIYILKVLAGETVVGVEKIVIN